MPHKSNRRVNPAHAAKVAARIVREEVPDFAAAVTEASRGNRLVVFSLEKFSNTLAEDNPEGMADLLLMCLYYAAERGVVVAVVPVAPEDASPKAIPKL